MALIIVLFLAGCGGDQEQDAPSAPTATVNGESPPAASNTSGPDHPTGVGAVARDLAVPWGMAFLPDGTAVITERDSGRVLLLPTARSTMREVTVAGTIATHTSSESGLLGVAVSPTFETDHRLYFYVSTEDDNRVLTAELRDGRLGSGTPILTGIPTSTNHDGGQLLFGPDGMLYVSTGDALDSEAAQRKDSLAGKILRITPEGDAAPGNPWGSAVWSMGHRNVQGLAFDDDGNLWASEFGDQAWDELNLIVKGGNYGWPLMEGNDRGPDWADVDTGGFRAPVLVWRTDEASPSGLAWFDGSLWLGALRGTRLWQVPVQDGVAGTAKAFFVGELGRIRGVVTDGEDLWISTSNRDGRGDPAAHDDRILQVTFR